MENKYKKVKIKWFDSTSYKKIWWNQNDLDETIKESEEKDYFYSTGYLIRETKRHYYLSNSLHIEDGDVIEFAQIFTIPKGCCESLKIIK